MKVNRKSWKIPIKKRFYLKKQIIFLLFSKLKFDSSKNYKILVDSIFKYFPKIVLKEEKNAPQLQLIEQHVLIGKLRECANICVYP